MMAWLVGELLDHCPDLRYREFRVLVVLAWDAGKDRQCKPGMALIAQRAHCGQRTVSRALRSLSDQGLIKMVQAGSPGRCAIYEVLPMLSDSGQHGVAGTEDNMVSPVLETASRPQNRRQEQPELTTLTMSSPSEMLPTEASSSTRMRGRGAADIIRAAYPSATDDEIETITQDRADHGARSVGAVLAHEIREGRLRLPCDREGEDRHSSACRHGDPEQCVSDWCTCRCHTEPAGGQP
jgi:hypothetical protein